MPGSCNFYLMLLVKRVLIFWEREGGIVRLWREENCMELSRRRRSSHSEGVKLNPVGMLWFEQKLSPS